jgi:prophage DNA circulation protein
MGKLTIKGMTGVLSGFSRAMAACTRSLEDMVSGIMDEFSSMKNNSRAKHQ